MAKGTIVQAAGSATSGSPRAKRIEAAMLAAQEEATARGITDPDEIRRVKLEAREKVKRGG